MCGRFALYSSAEELAEAFALSELPPVAARYNIAPTQPVVAIRSDASGERRAVFLRWGLIPAWAKDPTIGNRLINARAETIAEKPAFRSAFKYRRCLIPASGFYEWQRTGNKKQPFYIHPHGDRPFAFAGLWEHWQEPGGSELETCTILTTAANQQTKAIHDRMPVILESQSYELWLDTSVQKPQVLLPLLVPYSAGQIEIYPVSTAVNNPANDGPLCLQRA
ncbi:SOS response-associated peptidase [Gloeobacter kilaueensis]|uniref:Abasic site processing protein n=1 Tax=Gloeobacter kilaueensis (strain ATCC BAA-2537 / CCAP 1431/1 / ULC 316 / JS1) TaxID=1183438 RepID=U5QMT3_GLOK1|nr:SOS response-associated peptidase [Gloeobacter kilaueensis]AGY60231.1 hypothetical protein GKIL_3985 [Gloeobacter kilaueensis JS1]